MRRPDDLAEYVRGKRTAEVAAHYGIGEDTARRWCKDLGIKPARASYHKRKIMEHDSGNRIRYCLSCTQPRCTGSCPKILEIE